MSSPSTRRILTVIFVVMVSAHSLMFSAGISVPGVSVKRAAAQPDPTPTATPLIATKTIYAYDMGIKISVPIDWESPVYSAGQMTVSPVVAN